MKEEAPTYHEIGVLSNYKEYRTWVFQQRATLRNYLIASGPIDAENDVLSPGSNEVRRFRQ